MMTILATLLEKPKLDEELVRLCVPAMERFAQQHEKNNGMKNGHITAR